MTDATGSRTTDATGSRTTDATGAPTSDATGPAVGDARERLAPAEVDASRERLAARQAELLRALLTGAPPPTGFDADRVAVEARALLAKRRGVVAALRPEVADALGDRFPALFDEYARTHPRTTGTRATQDAAAFAVWVTRHRRRRWWHATRLVLVAVLAVTALAGCGAPHTCPLILSVGVQVTVARQIVPDVRTVGLEVCWNGTCHHAQLALQGTSGVVPDSCTDADLTPACGAWSGFAAVPDLPRTPVTVHLTLTGDPTRDLRTEVTPVAHPTGRDCPDSGPQAQVQVTATGDLRPTP
jgi:hypothetical protein